MRRTPQFRRGPSIPSAGDPAEGGRTAALRLFADLVDARSEPMRIVAETREERIARLGAEAGSGLYRADPQAVARAILKSGDLK